jgi:hypothetical protein
METRMTIRLLSKSDVAAMHPSELVDRYVGKESLRDHRSYTRPLLVTSYSGTRLYARPSVVTMRTENREPRLLPVEEWDEKVPIMIKSVVYVCDTIEDCEVLMAACRKAQAIWDEGQKQIRTDINAVYSALPTSGEPKL